MIVCHVFRRNSPSSLRAATVADWTLPNSCSVSLPDLTGRSGIPETVVLNRDASGMLDAPFAAFAEASASP
jgi:hypothetical protein